MTRLALAALLAACSSSSSRGPATAPRATASVADAEAEAAEPDPEAQIAAIASAVNHYAPDVHRCWKLAAADDFRLGGTLVLRLEIGEVRSARASEVVQDEPGDPALRACMVELWERVVWPKGVFAAGDVIQLPPFEFVAPEAQHSVDRAHVPTEEVSGGALGGGDAAGGGQVAVQRILTPASTGSDDASLSLWTVAEGATVPLHRHPGRAELLYVVAGRGRLIDQRVFPPRADRRQAVDFAGHELTAGAAAYVAPGVAHGIQAEGESPLTLLLVHAPGDAPDEGAEVVAVPADRLGTRRARAEPRPRLAPGDRAEPLPIAGGKGSVRLLLDPALLGDGAPYLGLLDAAPGTDIPLHTHASSAELLYVLAGEGTLRVDGAEVPLGPGVAVQVPAGMEHGGTITGTDTFRAVQVYSPGGPEQRFKGAP